METAAPHIRVVLVSPGDVLKERVAAKRVVDELNGTVARGRLALWRWETDARPGLHPEGPQGMIDELMDMSSADLVIGVFWKRFGTATHDAQSGTEHELRAAWAAWRERRRPDVMVYFSDRPYTPKTPAEATQSARVLQFRDELPSEQLWWTYTKPLDFERLLRMHLIRYLHANAAGGLSASPSEREAVRFNVPEVAGSFTGRERELAAIDAAVRGGNRAVITQAITGLGGVGKSQVAARYAQLHANEYDIVAWIGAEDGGTKDLAGLAAELAMPVEGLAPSDMAQLALEELARTSLRWLLVLDNVVLPEQLAALRPSRGEGRVLVTSRDRALREFGRLITIDVFDDDTATAYLTDRADRPDDEDEARRLAAALGGLPLALSHAAAYCQFGTSFADYHALLDDLPASELFRSQPQLSYEQTVASTWRTSIQAATQDAPLAPMVLDMAAYLAPDAIPKTLFHALLDEDTPRSHKRLADAFGALARYSLATFDDATIGVHRLLQKTVRDAVWERADPTPGHLALRAVDDGFPSDADIPTQWPACEQLLAHAHMLSVTLTQPATEARRLVDLLNKTCSYLHAAKGGQRGVTAARTALACAERHLDADDHTRLGSRYYLAIAYEDAGQTADAISISEALLADCERILGTDDAATLITRNKLANAYRAVGRAEDAIAIDERLAADCERTLGAEHPNTLASRCNAGNAYREGGRTEEAIAIFESLLADCERIQGREHPNTLVIRDYLASAYLAAERVEDAIATYEPLRADQERIIGTEHPTALVTRHNLALAYAAAGRMEDAIAIYEPLLIDQERIIGSKHPTTLGTRHNLAYANERAGRVEDAIAIYEPLLIDQGRSIGSGHPTTLATRNRLATAYLTAGRMEDAIAIYEPLLADQEKIMGREHPTPLGSRNNLAVAYAAVGRAEDAIAIYQALLAEQERDLGAEHPTASSTRNNLAVAYAAVGRVEDAIAIYRALLAQQERSLGAEHPTTIMTRNNLAGVYQLAGRPDAQDAGGGE